MKSIHPFPARMASDIVDKYIAELPKNSTILDPMCGSGTVIRSAVAHGHAAIGTDLDPLAILMTQVATSKQSLTDAVEIAEKLATKAEKYLADTDLPEWIQECPETTNFVKFWFGGRQRKQLGSLVWALDTFATENGRGQLYKLFQLAISRMIITKHTGASLAWDVSHSRPHRKKTWRTNTYDVLGNFPNAVKRIVTAIGNSNTGKSSVYRADARNLTKIADSSVNAIFTSPPYLNAIDYMRGHKLALVWLGHSIPELRKVRASTIGAERILRTHKNIDEVCATALKHDRMATQLPQRQQGMLHRYLVDIHGFQAEYSRVLKKNGRMVVVLGDSYLNGVYVPNSRYFKKIAQMNNLECIEEYKRPLPEGRRYLPMSCSTGQLEKRMKHEVVQVYTAAA